MSAEDTARRNLSTALAARIDLEKVLPDNLSAMGSDLAWRLYCVLRDIENAETALVEVDS